MTSISHPSERDAIADLTVLIDDLPVGTITDQRYDELYSQAYRDWRVYAGYAGNVVAEMYATVQTFLFMMPVISFWLMAAMFVVDADLARQSLSAFLSNPASVTVALLNVGFVIFILFMGLRLAFGNLLHIKDHHRIAFEKLVRQHSNVAGTGRVRIVVDHRTSQPMPPAQ